jgi:demethylmenaquinone methyltransferase / 2-methoxy-6-polyprenyl-1,4-benzoquinol methylase
MKPAPVKPYEDQPGSKKEQVTAMFNRISGRYDLLNRVLSLGIDRNWRKILVRRLRAAGPQDVLDVATGTADLAMAIAQAIPACRVTGMDIAVEMLEMGRKKVELAGLSDRVALQSGDAENLPYPDHCFDAVTVAFGVRNFETLSAGLAEMHRVLRPEGQVWVLEFSQPRGWFRPFFLVYFKYLLPLIGRLSSKDPKAYRYLFESVQAFPEGEAFCGELEKAGFQQVSWTPLTFGTCSIYNGTR